MKNFRRLISHSSDLRYKLLLSVLFTLAVSPTFSQEKYFSIPEKGFTSWLPAPDWSDALLSGNGTLGAMVYGNPYDETIIVNHASLFLPNSVPMKPVDQASRLEEIKSLCLEGRFSEASKIPYEQSIKEGYGGLRWNDPFIPAFDIKINMEADNIGKYVRSVNFETGEAIVDWKQKGVNFQRSLFCSRSDTVIVLRIRSSDLINCVIDLRMRPVAWNNRDYINSTMENVNSFVKDDYLIYTTDFKKDWEGSLKGFEGVGKIILNGGSYRSEGNKISIKNAKEVLFLLKVKMKYNRELSYIDKLKAEISSLPANYNTLLEAHKKVHGEMFNRVKLNLEGDKEDYSDNSEIMMQKAKTRTSRAYVEKQFYASRYNIMSATGINPPNLQGIWGGLWTPPWSSVYTNDGNVPTAVSSFLNGNLSELLLAYTRYHERMRPYYRENARNMFNCRGIVVPAHSGTHGYANHISETWCLTLWTAGAGWVAGYFYDYYLFTGDTDFLKEHAYPFLKETALFYEDFLQRGDNGKYIFNPSYSPENNPSNSESQATINATMDVLVAKQVLRNCISSAKILKTDRDKIPVWKKMLSLMPDYELDSNGVLREWIWKGLEENHTHRHVSHLYGLYDLIDPDFKADTNLLNGAAKVLEERMKVRRNEGGGQMVFGMVQMACVAANLGQKEILEDIVGWLSAQYWTNALGSYHDPNSLFNMDLSGGFQNIIFKALVYSEPGYISLFPALPSDWKKGSIEGVLLRNQMSLKKLQWEDNWVRVTLTSEIAQTIEVKLPSSIKNISVIEGKVKPVLNNSDSRRMSMGLNKGGRVSLKIEIE